MKVPGLDLISLCWVMWPFLNKPCGPWPGSVTIRFYDKVHVTILEAGSGVSPTQATWTGNGGGGSLQEMGAGQAALVFHHLGGLRLASG